MRMGDCAVFDPLRACWPNSAGVARVRLWCETATSSTKRLDQWHSTWAIRGYGEQQIARLPTFDGAEMSTVGAPGTASTTVSLATSQWLDIAVVERTGAC